MATFYITEKNLATTPWRILFLTSELANKAEINLNSRALLRMAAKERRALGNPEVGVFLLGFREEQRPRTWLGHSNEKFA